MGKPSSRWWLRQESEQAFVAASAESVYQLLADMPRMGEWSPECQQVEWTGDTASRWWALDLSATTVAVRGD